MEYGRNVGGECMDGDSLIHASPSRKSTWRRPGLLSYSSQSPDLIVR